MTSYRTTKFTGRIALESCSLTWRLANDSTEGRLMPLTVRVLLTSAGFNEEQLFCSERAL